MLKLWPFPLLATNLRQIARINGRVRFTCPDASETYSHKLRRCNLSSDGQRNFCWICWRLLDCSAFITVIVHYVCAIAALNYDAYIRSAVAAGFELSLPLTVDGRQRIAVLGKGLKKKKEFMWGIVSGTHRSRCGQIMMYLLFVIVAAYPTVYSQFPQAIPQPMTAVAPTQREGKYNTLINV